VEQDGDPSPAGERAIEAKQEGREDFDGICFHDTNANKN